MTKILITGAGGQLGSELTETLVSLYGSEAIVASDINPEANALFRDLAFEKLDVTDFDSLDKVCERHGISHIYHLAAILSASGEKKPLKSWQVNMDSLLHVLEIGRQRKLDKIFWPSSIAVFGPDSPKNPTPQNTVQEPTTVYGISKQAGERWCAYYYQKYGLDVRSLRYPGLIGYKSLPGGGTTDYAVDIYHHAVLGKPFICFLKKDTALPMMYMPDAIRATLELMHAPAEKITVRSSYNISALSITPEAIFNSILAHVPQFVCEYKPDFRQEIADSWPDRIDDSHATTDWGWQPHYTLDRMTEDMLSQLQKRLVDL